MSYKCECGAEMVDIDSGREAGTHTLVCTECDSLRYIEVPEHPADKEYAEWLAQQTRSS